LGDVIRLYIIAACIAALAAGVLWVRHDAVQSERAARDAKDAQTTITNTEKFNEAAYDPNSGDSWFDRLFPGRASD
jgi:hypothetical protein